MLSGRTEARLGTPEAPCRRRAARAGARRARPERRRGARAADGGGSRRDRGRRREALNERAEGWAAGLYLAALSLDGGSSSVASFGGDDRFVTDYLRAEELNRVEPAQLEFLLRTSVLEPMCAPLCDAVLERDDSAQMLEQLERQNLFVVALDHQRRWFRYHHLFREMLQAELERREPELPAALNRRAAAWCKANGQPEVAIEYSAAAGDTDEVARARRRARGSVLPQRPRDHGRALARALRRSRRCSSGIPRSRCSGVWVHALRGRPETAERWALAVETAQSEDTMPDGSPLEAWAATVRALLCRKGVEQMQIDAELALSRLPASEPVASRRLVLHGMAVLFSGDPARAEVILDEAADAAVAGGATWAGVVARSERALLALERGDLAAAESELALAARVRRRRAVDGLCRDRDPAGSHGKARNRQGARRASPDDARELRSGHARC